MTKVAYIVPGGGLAPGVGLVIYYLTKELHKRGWKVVGSINSTDGISGPVANTRALRPEDSYTRRGLTEPGCWLGTKTDGKTLNNQQVDNVRNNTRDASAVVLTGGDGTLRVWHIGPADHSYEGGIVQRASIQAVTTTVPKTVDSDIYGIDITLGTRSGAKHNAGLIKRKHTYAQQRSDKIVFVIDVMGRESSVLTSRSAMEAGRDSNGPVVDVCLSPERYNWEELKYAASRAIRDNGHAIVLVSEGIPRVSGHKFREKQKPDGTPVIPAGVSKYLAEQLQAYFKKQDPDVRVISHSIGHEQTTAPVCHEDRILAKQIAVQSADDLEKQLVGCLPQHTILLHQGEKPEERVFTPTDVNIYYSSLPSPFYPRDASSAEWCINNGVCVAGTFGEEFIQAKMPVVRKARDSVRSPQIILPLVTSQQLVNGNGTGSHKDAPALAITS